MNTSKPGNKQFGAHPATGTVRGRAVPTAGWFRGQLHAHTYWSDGRGFLEQAVAAHKDRGYHFFCVSDHNRFGDDPDAWREVADEEGPWPPKVSRAVFERYLEAFGAGWVASRPGDADRSVRLRTYAEVKARFEEPGRFIMLPGVELTQLLDGINLHLNCVNLPLVPPSLTGAALNQRVAGLAGLGELVARNIAETGRAAAELGVSCLLMLNHPFWRYYDIEPQLLIDFPQIRLFEVCTGGSGSDFPPFAGAAGYTPEKFWDIVNAFRCRAGAPLIYGAGSDDAHFYDPERISGKGGVGGAWVMVRAASLDPSSLVSALLAGDFYATNGVLLEAVSFCPADNSLCVRVKAEPGVNYRVVFIATGRGFDDRVGAVRAPAGDGRPDRTIPRYSEDIGRVVASVEGPEAVYRLAGDDLYVRARVESDRPARLRGHFYPAFETAWTQPWVPTRRK